MFTRSLPVSLAVLTICISAARADVGDPTLETNHPHYAGEGAFQTVEQCVRRATQGKKTQQEQAIALYLWILNHQCHMFSPQEFCVPGMKPDSRNENQPELIVSDVNRARFSYGYALCGTVHHWNQTYWKALGLKARSRGFPGHTSSEIEYGGGWHLFDTDMAGLVFRRDGVCAGYDDIIKDVSLVNVDKSPLPRFPFAWPADFKGMKEGFEEIAKGGAWHKLYNSSYSAHPAVVHLRAGETFTRYFNRDHFGGVKNRRFWQNQAGGPFRDWTFINQGTPEHRGSKSNSRGNASYCNGEFIYRPDLAASAWREGVVHSENVDSGATSPRLRTKDKGEVSVTFHHFSPYVIAGCPDDGANPMTKPAKGGLVLAGEAVGEVKIDVSADLGQTWNEIGPVQGRFEKDLTDLVKGRYGWQVRLRWNGDAGLDALTFSTVTQVSQIIYPRLNPNGSDVIYRASARGVVPVLPNFGLTEKALRLEEKPLRSANVVYHGRSPKSRLAYSVKDNKPGTVVFKIESPADLLQVTAAAKYSVRVPPPDKCDYRLELSTDAGKTWQPLGRADVPKDNEANYGWMYGAADVSTSGVKSALVRVHLYQGGYTAGLMAADFYGVYRTPPPQAVKLTYAWKDAGKLLTHVENIPAGAREHRFQIPTGKAIVDEYVRMEVK